MDGKKEGREEEDGHGKGGGGRVFKKAMREFSDLKEGI